MDNIARMDDIARIVNVNEAARSPEVRKNLFQRVDERHDSEAFEILYRLYSCDTWKDAFHPLERRVMQKLLIEYLDAFLSLLERKEISEDARLAMARCLQKFLPGHPDIFEFDSLEKRIVSAMVGETGSVFRALDELLCAVNARWAEAQAQSEPE